VILSWVNSSDLFSPPVKGDGRGEGESKIVLPPLSSPEMGEEEKRHGIIIIKDEIVGAIHELPLRDTN